ncbi:hypothetical protein [Bradyrhizobium sp. sBnM-33]|uniref:hypothetical protein n=1 Tax=Bradyrhizobium sp. sBnM-33 TaxID=2831780 RepID=UPI001BD19EB6|nr:hypothetical protein [Bradyrhizobium sp. sBnM-33]WOH48228.1 hypothetical protein RX328_29385 [Bradyrhizobium sp. sBnM-33]
MRSAQRWLSPKVVVPEAVEPGAQAALERAPAQVRAAQVAEAPVPAAQVAAVATGQVPPAQGVHPHQQSAQPVALPTYRRQTKKRRGSKSKSAGFADQKPLNR